MVSKRKTKDTSDTSATKSEHLNAKAEGARQKAGSSAKQKVSASDDLENLEEFKAEAVDEDGGEAIKDFENETCDTQDLSVDELKEELQTTKEDLVKALAMVTETQNIASKAQDQYLNLKKEWDNFRKRNEEQKEQEKILANEKLVEELLPVLDDMERAYGHALEINDESPLKEGIKVIYDKFVQILSKFSVEQIDPFDEPFDANVHQAVSTQVDKTKDQDTVIGVIQKGYLMGTKVLRPAMVITSTKN